MAGYPAMIAWSCQPYLYPSALQLLTELTKLIHRGLWPCRNSMHLRFRLQIGIGGTLKHN